MEILMDKLNIHLITDNDKNLMDDLVNLALVEYEEEINVYSYPSINNQLDLEKLLLKIERSKSTDLIFHAFSHIGLKRYIGNFCDLHNIQEIDMLTPISIAASNSLAFKDSLEDMDEDSTYFKKADAINFADRYDDGKNLKGLQYADIVIIGISRTSKTPLSLYFANLSYRTINIPLVPESPVPEELFEVDPKKIFGLTDEVENIKARRKNRLQALGLPENSQYAQDERILEEISYAHGIMKEIGCPIINVSDRAIEEVADIIIRHLSK